MMSSEVQPLGSDAVARYQREGYLRFDGIVDAAEVRRLTRLLEPLYSGELDAGEQRLNLGDFHATKADCEHIVQVMLPSDFVS